MPRPEHPWAVLWDELTILPYFSNPIPIPGSTDHVQLTADGIARTLLLGREHARGRKRVGLSFSVTVGPSTRADASDTTQDELLAGLRTAKDALVPLTVVMEIDQLVDTETSTYVVRGFFTILSVELIEGTGCELVLDPVNFTNPFRSKLVVKGLWDGYQCNQCNRLVHIDDWDCLICSNCSFTNGHLLPRPVPLSVLRPPHRVVTQGARMDRGFPNLLPDMTQQVTMLSDRTEFCSYELGGGLGLGEGKRVTIHHVLSREGDGALAVPNRVLVACQKREVPMERHKVDSKRLPLRTHLTGSPSPSCLPALPSRSTTWEQASKIELDMIEYLNQQTANCGVEGDEYTQLLITQQQPGEWLSRTPIYRPPSSTTLLAFLSLGSDCIITFRHRAHTTLDDPSVVFNLVQHGDIFVLAGEEGALGEIEWVVQFEKQGEHYGFVAQHVPLDEPKREQS